ncbi:MAG: class I SAM-dependent methyltransferase [Lactobacillales bacterium]|jgi:SAM-dependent methyltransferase|nr:class I SAM-dependent methyltransferase [Lactobacillales bacterium]
MNCRFCQNELKTEFLDLGTQPCSNNYVDYLQQEVFYPLITYVCQNCGLVQTLDFNSSEELFTEDYAYFSSYSKSWLEHAKKYVDMITKKLNLNESSQVIELASNDGYLLQYFSEKNIPSIGIEPCESVAKVAMRKGIDTRIHFFGKDCAEALPKADLILGNNVLAHVPDINDFVSGVKIALKHSGTVTFEFPHLLNLIDKNQFDTIYHEHYSYLSLSFVQKLFDSHGLDVYDVEELKTHGGSLRVYGCHKGFMNISDNVSIILNKEKKILSDMSIYTNFSARVKQIKRDFLELLIDIKNKQKSVVPYGAAAKGNTLFNYCGIKNDFIDYVADLNPHKQGKYLPGVHIEIKAPEEILKTKPDYVIITPWNLREEIMKQLEYVKEWDCKFIVVIPEVKVL